MHHHCLWGIVEPFARRFSLRLYAQAADVPGEVGATGREVLAALGRRGAEFGAERAMLLEGLVALETAMLRAKVQVDGVGGALAWLQVLVEGCVNGTDHCGVVPPVPQHGAPPGPPGLNPCTYGGRAEFRDADFSAGGPHSWGAGQHPRGVPAELPGGRPSPACRDLSTGAAHTCPCCVACQGAARALADARAALPRAQDLGVLNATLPPEEAPAAAQRAAAAYAQPLASVAEALAPVRAGAGVAADKATYVSRLVLAGLLAVLLPLWVVLVRLCITLHRASTRAEAEDAASGLGTGTGAEGFPELLERCGHWGSMASARDRAAWRGERAHEAGRVAGCSERCGCSELNVEAFPGKSIAGVACLLAVLLAPALAALSLLVLPLSDLCSLLPASAGADVEPLLQVLDANGGEDGFAARGLKACLLPRHGGSVWTVAGVDDSAIDARLGLRNFSDVIPRAAVARALDAQRYAPYFADLLDALVDLAARATSVPGDFGVDSCPPAEEAFPGCAADEAALGAAIAARAAQAHVEGEALAATVAVLAELSRALAANVTALEARADAASAEMRILVWQAGTCDSMHAAWAGLRVALCEGVGPGLAAAWGALSLAIALFPLLALLACHVAQLDKTTPQTSGSADDEWSANERVWVSWRAEGAGAGQSESLGAASEAEGEDLPNDEWVDGAEETSRLLPLEAGQGWKARSARERDRRARPPSHE